MEYQLMKKIQLYANLDSKTLFKFYQFWTISSGFFCFNISSKALEFQVKILTLPVKIFIREKTININQVKKIASHRNSSQKKIKKKITMFVLMLSHRKLCT
jgi:hypothetical protein